MTSYYIIECIVLSSNSKARLSNDTWKSFNYQHIRVPICSLSCSTFVCILVINHFSFSLSLSFVYLEYCTVRPFIDIVLLVDVYSAVAMSEEKKEKKREISNIHTLDLALILFAWRNIHWCSFNSISIDKHFVCSLLNSISLKWNLPGE